MATRGRLMQACRPGAMAAVHLPPAELSTLLPEGVEIAAVNAPELCAISGETDKLGGLVEDACREGCSVYTLENVACVSLVYDGTGAAGLRGRVCEYFAVGADYSVCLEPHRRLDHAARGDVSGLLWRATAASGSVPGGRPRFARRSLASASRSRTRHDSANDGASDRGKRSLEPDRVVALSSQRAAPGRRIHARSGGASLAVGCSPELARPPRRCDAGPGTAADLSVRARTALGGPAGSAGHDKVHPAGQHRRLAVRAHMDAGRIDRSQASQRCRTLGSSWRGVGR